MSTRSNIGILNPEGTFAAVYCHFDGYLEGVGATLAAFHNSEEAARAIVALGNVSVLDETLDCPEGHAFRNQAAGCTVFYGRDGGEEAGQEAEEYQNIDAWLAADPLMIEFLYLWRNGRWEYTESTYGGHVADWKPLSE